MNENDKTVEEVKAAFPLPKVPVVVISGTKAQPPVFTPERRKEITWRLPDVATIFPAIALQSSVTPY
jgi:hypothetical protein